MSLAKHVYTKSAGCSCSPVKVLLAPLLFRDDALCNMLHVARWRCNPSCWRSHKNKICMKIRTENWADAEDESYLLIRFVLKPFFKSSGFFMQLFKNSYL